MAEGARGVVPRAAGPVPSVTGGEQAHELRPVEAGLLCGGSDLHRAGLGWATGGWRLGAAESLAPAQGPFG